jgi:hypothetical protein
MTIFLIRLFPASATYILVALASSTQAFGIFKVAEVALPPSPEYPPVPVPAILVVTPVDIVTLRIRLLIALMYIYVGELALS